MRKLADEMERIDGMLAGVYAGKSGKDETEMQGLMDAETWMTAEEAVELGLADEVEESKQIAACITGDMLLCNGISVDLARFGNTEKVRGHVPESSGTWSQGAVGHTHMSPSHNHMVPDMIPSHTNQVRHKAQVVPSYLAPTPQKGYLAQFETYAHATKPENGGESEPVSDKATLGEQQKRFWNIRKKLNGGLER